MTTREDRERLRKEIIVALQEECAVRRPSHEVKTIVCVSPEKIAQVVLDQVCSTHELKRR